MIHKDYICDVLGRFEGRAFAYGYVPCRPRNYTGEGCWKDRAVFGVSGVTIGSGLDLGQQTLGRLESMGLPPGIIKQLTPYLGLKKEAALKKLSETPLTLSAEEVRTLDAAVKSFYINTAASLFGRERFEAAPKQAQAVAVSLHYQFGAPASAASPSLKTAWDLLRAGAYKQAASHLASPAGWSAGHRQYMARRKQEAALLEEIA